MESDITDGDNDGELDEHFCIKCKKTLLGLENYIQHRKRKCSDLDQVGLQ